MHCVLCSPPSSCTAGAGASEVLLESVVSFVTLMFSRDNLWFHGCSVCKSFFQTLLVLLVWYTSGILTEVLYK